MTHEHELSKTDVDLERALGRYLTDNRMTRRQLLERVAAVGATTALAPILAACAGAASPSPSPSAAAAPTSGSTAPSATPPPTPLPTPEKELFVYNWDAYIGDKTVAKFQAKYGIKVHYDKFPDAATQITKLRSDGKGGGYDIAYPTSVEIPGLAKDGVIQPLMLDLIPNATNLGEKWQNPGYDPGNKYSMPYMWWTTGFAWDGDKIKEDLDSWEALWNPVFKQKMAMLEDNREVYAVAAFRLGLDPNSKSDTDIAAMTQLLEEQKPLLRDYTEDDIGSMSSGDVILCHAWSGDVWQMELDNVRYVIPKEGAIRGSDTMIVTSGAPHPVAANLWINFNLDAEISGENTNVTGYMGPNAAATKYISKEILEDPNVNPDLALLDKLVELLNLGVDEEKYTDAWNALKA
jgi:spermidine/putrescine transport system substrate-binding protein